ncbi:histidine phosphatase family protein [Cutibacterium acnes]|nr:phosphoglycerate kinase [Cutibacterium acnes]KPG66677.1 phosphoglycerate kinase [Cutibacterium acnes]PZA02324.1 histidine phosphatase family protein [Cutibacterium acnes]
MSCIVIVRHGQSTWNRQGRIQGQTMGVRLTMRGRGQARQAARAVASLVPHGTPIVASDQKRAVQTARPIARVLGVQVMTDPRLREQGLGAMEGHTADELEPLPQPTGVHPADVRWAGGESLADVAERCHSLLDDLAARHLSATVLVTHGDTMRVLLGILDGRSHRDLDWDLSLTNGSVMVRNVDLGELH